MNLPHGLRLDATAHCLHLVRMADGLPITPVPAPLAVELAPLCEPPLRSLATHTPTPYDETGAAPGAREPCGERLSSRAVRFGEWTFRLTPFDPALDPAPDGRSSIAVPDALLARATLRPARTGDHIRPFGAQGGKPLRRYFTDRHIDAPFRPVIPLICLGRHVLWAVGVGASETTRLTGGPATRITAEGDAPWIVPLQDGLKTEKETPTGRSMPV